MTYNSNLLDISFILDLLAKLHIVTEIQTVLAVNDYRKLSLKDFSGIHINFTQQL